jgi:hypothetical protein
MVSLTRPQTLVLKPVLLVVGLARAGVLLGT